MEGKKKGSPVRTFLIVLISLIVVFVAVFQFGIRQGDRNLIIITVDTVRADRLGCYGYRDIRTPNIDFLAANGVLFENAISAAPLTLPSHTTILTGLYPTVHGVRDNTTYRLSDKAITLTEILRENGYRTGAVVGAFVLDSSYGLDQGFDTYDDELTGPSGSLTGVPIKDDASRVKMKEISERPASVVTRRVLSWLRKNRDETFFLWIHYYDPHFPYNPPPPFSSKYLNDPYVGEIASVDNNIGAVIGELRKTGMLEKTLIVVAGDHGEGLGDHQEQTHSIFVYDSTIRVPLIMSCSDIIPAGSRINDVVSLADVVPTILELLEIESTARFDGVSLAGTMMSPVEQKERYVYSESMFPYLNYGWSEVHCLRGPRWKYIKAPVPELYDVSIDPLEMNNVAETEGGIVSQLDEILVAKIDSVEVNDSDLAADVALSGQDRERLAALGYLSGAPPVREKASLKDPKVMIEYHDLINRGEKALDSGMYDEALESFREVVGADPSNALVHNLIGMVYYQLGDTTTAKHHFEEAIELNPNLADAHHNLGNIYFQNENYREAAVYYENAVKLEPANGDYFVALAQIYARSGDRQKAGTAFDRAIELGATSPQLFLANGNMLMNLGRFEESRKNLDEAIKLDPGYSEAYNEYGNLMEQIGDFASAITKYKQALSINPTFTKARYNLSRILIKTGKDSEAMTELETVISDSPQHAEAHYLLGELYYRSGNRKLARENFLKFLEIGTTNEGARKQAEARLAELG